MLFLLLSLFLISLVYLTFYRRVRRYIKILVAQGIILSIIAIFSLHEIDILHLTFILLETIIIKAFAIPVFMENVRKRNHLMNISQSKTPPFVSMIVISATMIFGFFVSQMVQADNIHREIFAVAIICIISGLYFIIIHLNIFTHLVGYLVVENGIFLLALAIGSEMPIMVNLAILLDIFVGVLVLGVFINRIGDNFKKLHIDELSKLVD